MLGVTSAVLWSIPWLWAMSVCVTLKIAAQMDHEGASHKYMFFEVSNVMVNK